VAVKVGADPEQVYDPMDPALAGLQEKILLLFEALKVAVPSIVSVTFTVFVLGLAEKPIDAGHVPVYRY
jgi:hypothetical protein